MRFAVISPLKFAASAVIVPVNVGEAENTKLPAVPVSSVTAAARFALEGVARNVAIPVPKPDMPVVIDKLVQLVNVPDCGVPRIGVVSVGDVNVLFVKVCVPVRVTTDESIERLIALFVSG